MEWSSPTSNALPAGVSDSKMIRAASSLDIAVVASGVYGTDEFFARARECG